MNKDIDQIDIQIQAKKDELEADVSRFIEVCAAFAKEVLESKVRSAIHSQPERVEETGEAGLKKMKEEVEKAHVEMDKFTEDLINRDGLWAHRKGDLNTTGCEFGAYQQYGNRLPDQVEEQVRLLLSPAGRVLIENQFADPKDWENRDGLHRYRYGISWSDEQKAVMKSYGEKFSELWRLLEEKERLIAQKKGDQALDQWDKL
ncbi:hypothetical protein LZG37_23065 [Halomonas titanicae]|uniref:hypothetical protein n=1 Tax=Vreelandella titanicae TaxID=664683 RepID=UPI001F1E3951|nr:hypothetical protein [Halomonas titanicae]MCE7521021.1 hypothetical protein [Halomonas titanicae]